MGGRAGDGAAVDAAVGAVQAAHAARAGGANSAMANLNANARAAAERTRNARAAAEDAADLDLPSLDANEAAAARRTWRPGQSAGSNANSGENDSMYERSKLNPVLTFDNFVTGKANQLARAAAIQVADNPGISYNPLFLYGGVGLGKTHLIHAIGNQLLMDKAGARIRYIHAEQYVSDVVKAYQRKAFDDFKRYYHSLDLLLIDDIQFFSGKSRTQEEFFYAFEALVANKAQVIITSDTYPKEISGIDDRLISRFDSGLTVAIEPPELEMRVAILMRKAQSEFVSLNEDVAFFVAKHLRSNVRELEGALRKILAYSKFHGREITIEADERSAERPADGAEPADFGGKHPEDRGGLLQHQGRRHVFEEASREHRAAAADRDVSGEGADAEELAGNRRAVRRARPHHRAARGAQNCRRAQQGRATEPRTARAGADAEGLSSLPGKNDLFISKLAPILVRRFRFQAQYRFNRPAAVGGFHAVTGAAWRRRGAVAARRKAVLARRAGRYINEGTLCNWSRPNAITSSGRCKP